MKFDPYDLNKRGAFGAVKQVQNVNTDGYFEDFVPEVKKWYAVRTRTMNQTYQIFGTDLQDTLDIVIRHDPTIKPPLLFQANDGSQYNVVSSSPDNSGSLNAFDILTLKQVKRKGAAHG